MNINRIKEYYNGPEYLEKLRGRAANMKSLSENTFGRSQLLNVMYANDFRKFCEDFLFLMIPEYGDSVKPFFLFPYQIRIIDKILADEAYGGDVETLIDKPRGMGITWIFCAFMLWRWLFTPNFTAFVLSRTETEVDDGTASPGNSLFAKIRWMQRRFPPWIMPEGFKMKGEKGTATDSSLRILNPVLGSAIIGSSTNSNAGRSRRYSMILVDECFSIDRFTETHRSLQTVARRQYYVSTTKASREAKKFKESCERSGNYISLDWRDHPWKDQEWYEEQLRKAEFDPEVMKEVDKGYSVSKKLQYYPEIELAKVVKIPYNPELPVYCGLDFGKADLTVIVWAQFDGNQINVIECYANRNKGKAEWYAPFMNPEWPVSNEFQYTPGAVKFLERVRSWRKPTAWFGELAHRIASMADNTSIAMMLARCGIRLLVNTHAVEYEPRRKATALVLSRTVFNEDSEGAMNLYDALADSRYKESISSKRTTMEPVHDDEIADYRAAFENLCVNIPRIFKHQRAIIDDRMKMGGFINTLREFLKV